MKFLNNIALLTLLLAIITGCSANDNYQFLQEGSDYYIVIPGQADSSDPQIAYQVDPLGMVYTISGFPAPDAVEFSGIQEMISDIEAGNFTEDEFRNIRMFHSDEAGRIKVCDIETLYEPIFPDTYTDYTVFWWGEYYTFSIHNADSSRHAHFFEITPETWEGYVNTLQNYKQELSSLARVHNLISEYDDQNKIHVYLYASRDNAEINQKEIVYSFASGTSTYYILEKYDLDASEIVPTHVSVFGASNGRYFYVSITEPKERPSIEWISQFVLKEYIPQ